MDRTPKPMEQYLHFKGGRYQVLQLARMEDTGEQLVIYQAMYGEGEVYARRLESFVSEVDHEKYPGVSQRWRFLRIVPPEEDETARPEIKERTEDPGPDEKAAEGENPDLRQTATVARGSEPDGKEPGNRRQSNIGPEGGDREDQEEQAADPYLVRFLEAQTLQERLDALSAARGHLTDGMIDAMGYVMGIEIEPGPVEARAQDLRDCLLTVSRYELDRSRFRRE